MNLVDSCGWLEYFAGGPNASFFSRTVEDTENLLIPTICMIEVYKEMHRQLGENAARKAMHAMRLGTTIPLDSSIALAAARLGIEHKLPLADSIILATARARDATLWTQDDHFEKIERVEYRAAR